MPLRRRVAIACFIFSAGILFHAWVQLHAGRQFDAQFVSRLLLVALPYFVQSLASLLGRTVLGSLLFGALFVGFVAFDLTHIRQWSMRGWEASIDVGFLWMGQLFLAIFLSFIASMFGLSYDEPKPIA
jgi:hypothetical protein